MTRVILNDKMANRPCAGAKAIVGVWSCASCGDAHRSLDEDGK